jgi:hypothetical protein
MRQIRRTVAIVALAVVTASAALGPLSAQSAAPPSPKAPAVRDGQHDFDWMVGTWKAHLKRLVNPLTGSTTWVEFDGTQHTRQIWNGRASVDEFAVDNPAAKTKIEGLTVRLYNPTTDQWSIYWANAKNGAFSMPATVGRWTNGRGEFHDHEEIGGRMILVRYVWSDVSASGAHFEQSFSEDGGKTWEANWISDLTRAKEAGSQ